MIGRRVGEEGGKEKKYGRGDEAGREEVMRELIPRWGSFPRMRLAGAGTSVTPGSGTAWGPSEEMNSEGNVAVVFFCKHLIKSAGKKSEAIFFIFFCKPAPKSKVCTCDGVRGGSA